MRLFVISQLTRQRMVVWRVRVQLILIQRKFRAVPIPFFQQYSRFVQAARSVLVHGGVRRVSRVGNRGSSVGGGVRRVGSVGGHRSGVGAVSGRGRVGRNGSRSVAGVGHSWGSNSMVGAGAVHGRGNSTNHRGGWVGHHRGHSGAGGHGGDGEGSDEL